jgi:hypothetical protein
MTTAGYQEVDAIHYATSTEKLTLFTSREQLYMVGVELSNGQFGERWEYSLIKATGGERFVIALTRNGLRDKSAETVRQLLESVDQVGPVVLDQVPSTKGNAAWVFRAVKQAQAPAFEEDGELASLEAASQPDGEES